MVDVAQLAIKVDTTDLARGEAALESLQREGKSAERAVKSLDGAAKRAGRSFDAFGAHTKSASNSASVFSSEIERLALKFDPAIAAVDRYQTELEELKRAYQLGAISTGVYENALEQLQAELVRTEGAAERAGIAATRAAVSTARVGGSVGAAGRQFQNASFQVADFATQVASGQRASVALAQQLPQLLGGFGILGAALGAVVAVGGALVPVLMSAMGGASDFDDVLNDLADTSDNLKEPLKRMRLEVEDLIRVYGAAAGQVQAFSKAQAELRVGQATAQLREQVDVLDGLIGKYTSAQDAGRTYLNTLGRIERDFGLTGSAAKEFENVLSSLENARTLDEQEASLQAILGFLEDNNIELSKVPDELSRAIDKMITLQIETAALERVMADVAAEAQNMTFGIPNALDLFGGNLLPSDPGSPEAETTRPQRGGGGAADTFANELDALRESLQTEREILDQWYADGQDILADRRAQEILGEQGHREALLRIEEEYQSRLRDIRVSEQDRTLGYTAQFFGAMAQATQAGGDKMAKAAAVFGGVEATINAYRAAAQALADPTVPFWGKAAAYASVLATGLQAVSAIRSAGSGGAPAATAATPTAPVAPNTSPRVALTLVGSETATFSKDQVRDLINAINEEVEGGAIVRLA